MNSINKEQEQNPQKRQSTDFSEQIWVHYALVKSKVEFQKHFAQVSGLKEGTVRIYLNQRKNNQESIPLIHQRLFAQELIQWIESENKAAAESNEQFKRKYNQEAV